MTDWHRIFTVSLADVLTGTPFEVDGERELSCVMDRIRTHVAVAIAMIERTELQEHLPWPTAKSSSPAP